ncbi:MAG: Na(+)-translocating NADH-quinone reductase subunit C, partial [Zoogloeaceae bacterium]|nr:Na(+)-translocating NADH-quinone reductase subunit C [Zoogloeaceae bacterium]
ASIFVAGAAVTLKPVQEENKLLDRQRSILAVAGVAPPSASAAQIREIFKTRIRAEVIDLATGKVVEGVDPLKFDAVKAAKDPATSEALPAAEDIAGIKRRENQAVVYWLEQDGKPEALILPVRGYGLWSTLYGFLAVKPDLDTVVGLGFYQHAETPGLGGEVDNPKWKALWPGKTLFDANGKAIISIVKGGVDPASPDAGHEVDALAGATLTSKGVDHLIHFWLGEQGFGPFLARLKQPQGGV